MILTLPTAPEHPSNTWRVQGQEAECHHVPSVGTARTGGSCSSLVPPAQEAAGAAAGLGSSYCKRQPVAGLLELHLSQDQRGFISFLSNPETAPSLPAVPTLLTAGSCLRE